MLIGASANDGASCTGTGPVSISTEMVGRCAQELAQVKAALSAEQSRTLKVEAELAEARNKLEGVRELEKELARFRAMQSEAEAAKRRGGLWGYISGQ